MTHSALTAIAAPVRLFTVTALLLLASGSGWAQGTPAATNDPVVATVDGRPIRLSELRDAMDTLPQNARTLPPQTLYPLLLDQMIDGRALAAEARRDGVDKDPAVER